MYFPFNQKLHFSKEEKLNKRLVINKQVAKKIKVIRKLNSRVTCREKQEKRILKAPGKESGTGRLSKRHTKNNKKETLQRQNLRAADK